MRKRKEAGNPKKNPDPGQLLSGKCPKRGKRVRVLLGFCTNNAMAPELGMES